MPGPTELSARSLGPDLARGVMLLFIALANSHYFLWGGNFFGGFPHDVHGLDSAATWTISTFVDGRAFPMFGLLFGYGVAQIVRRQDDAPSRDVRRLLWRRALCLIVVGFLHAVLLYAGDILTAYGVLLLVGAFAVRWKDKWLLIIAGLLLLSTFFGSDSSTISRDVPDDSMLPPDLFTMVTARAAASAFVGGLGWLGFVCPFFVGLWAGRRRVLEQTEQYRTMLVTVAVFGIAAAVIGAQPIARVLAGIDAPPSTATLEAFGGWHDGLGTLGGFGYAALICLVAPWFAQRPNRFVDALAAVGQRSMTCYLAQSVVWMIAFTPWLLGLANDLSIAGTAMLATVTWLATVALADWMRRTNRRGPFEVLVRRATYGRSAIARATS